MSDYARANTGGATHFGDKDGLTTGDADKVIVGAQFDSEFNAILTAVNSKYDSDDIASVAEAEGESVNDKLITPSRLGSWSDANDGVVGDLHALSSQAADSLYGWDIDNTTTIGWAIGSGLQTTATDLEVTLFGLEDLSAPATNDSLVYYDQTDSAFNWLEVGNGLEFEAGTPDVLGLVDVSAGAAQPVVITGGTFTFDLSSITELTATGVSQSGDGILISDAGTLKVMPVDQAGWPVVSSDAAQNITLTEMNTIQANTTTARTWTIRPDATDAGREIGTGLLILNSTASSDLTIDAATGVTLESRYHEGGVDGASDVVRPGGTALLWKYAADHWVLTGDIQDA